MPPRLVDTACVSGEFVKKCNRRWQPQGKLDKAKWTWSSAESGAGTGAGGGLHLAKLLTLCLCQILACGQHLSVINARGQSAVAFHPLPP